MARKRIQVKKIREILKHSYEGNLSIRQIAKVCGISKSVVSDYLSTFRRVGLTYENIGEMSDTELLELFKGKKEEHNARYQAMLPKMPYYAKELKRTGVTRQLLWEEYSENNDNTFSYSQFCYHLQCWQDFQDVSMKQHHTPGDKMFIDYTGDTFPYLVS